MKVVNEEIQFNRNTLTSGSDQQANNEDNLLREQEHVESFPTNNKQINSSSFSRGIGSYGDQPVNNSFHLIGSFSEQNSKEFPNKGLGRRRDNYKERMRISENVFESLSDGLGEEFK